GAGRHTLKLLGSVDIVGVDIVAILDESPDAIGSRILRVPVRPLSEAGELDIDAIVVSSDRWETQMLEKVAPWREKGIYVTGFYTRDDKAQP
ncbi:MAG: hypothetical protein P9L99_13645, partial [Candidatus Lernaella stagnicola]|nr:hypothetical protein [Candidatus Lernaella stagnicola]